MLSVGAFNALLKTLEEPPSYVIFILATTEAHKIPITILSRCQRYDFKRITVDTISARLSELMEAFSGLLFLIAAVLAILSFSRSKKKKHQFDFLQKGCNVNREGFDKLDHFVRQGFDLQKALIAGTVLCVLGPMISSSLGSIPLRMSGDISDFLLLAIESAGVFVLVYRSQIKKLMDRIHDILICGRKTD